MAELQVPSGTLLERLETVAALHDRNALLCGPAMGMGPAALKVAARHVTIHEQSALSIREAITALAQQGGRDG